MQDESLARFDQLLENLKANKQAEQQESDDRSDAFNEARSGGGNSDMMGGF